MKNKKKLIESLLKEESDLQIYSLNKLNELFTSGKLKLDYDSRFNVDKKVYSSYRDFNLILNLGRLQKDKRDCITYISNDHDHLEFEYIYDNGSIIPNRVYHVDNSEFNKKIQEMRKQNSQSDRGRNRAWDI